MKKKTLKRGRKSKEEVLIQELKDSGLRGDSLINEMNIQAKRFRERVNELLAAMHRLEADKEGLQVVIATLGIRIGQLQDINLDRHTNYSNMQTESVYSEAEKRM